MRFKAFAYLLVCLLILLAARSTSAQALDISSGGLPTITGAVNGSVTGSADVKSDLVVTINFGEVSPLNTNSIVKVVVPVGIRSNQPYQVAVSMSGLNNANSEAIDLAALNDGVYLLKIKTERGMITRKLVKQ